MKYQSINMNIKVILKPTYSRLVVTVSVYKYSVYMDSYEAYMDYSSLCMLRCK